MNRYKLLFLFALLIVPMSAAAQIRGDAAAVAAAERLLQYAGGREAWANARTFHVEERVFLRSGEVAQMKISRDLESGRRRLERSTSAGRYVEWLSPNEGWEVLDGVARDLAPEELAIRLQGLRQEPYAVYHRLAKRDPALRVAIRDENGLYVYDADEHLLGWFLFDEAGAITSWGNFWNGSINQHHYGPTAAAIAGDS